MSYNIMSKNASFKGDVSGTIENQVNDWDTQTIGGNKTFSMTVTSSADVMLSGSGKVSASFFFGDGSGLSGVATAAGATRQVQFNDGGSALGASADFKFTAANELQVTGQISASLGVSGSEFHGDGSNITGIDAANIAAGTIADARIPNLNASKITAGTLGDARIPSLNTSKITAGTFADARIAESNVTQHQAALSVAGGQITGAGSIDTGVLPTTISGISFLTSSVISASTFHGDGSALTGVSSTPTPAGSNTQIQFNADGALAGDAQLTFVTASNTLAVTALAVGSHISSSAYANSNGTIIDSNGNFSGNNAFFAEITASSVISSSANISGAAFIGDGRQLSGVPLGSSNASSVVFINNAGNQTITTNADFKFNGTDVLNDGGGFKGTTLSSSGDTSIGGNLKIGGQTLSAAELGVLDGVTAGTAAADKAMVLDSSKTLTGFASLTSETNNASRIILTGAAGQLNINLEGTQYRNTANAVTAKFLQTGVISASSDLQVGGHITGSGDLRLLDGNIHLKGGSKIFFDSDDGGAAIDVSISELGTNKLLLDGNNQVVIRQDEYFVIQDHSSTARFTADLRSTAAVNKISTDLVLSSSTAISASALHFADSPSAVITSGGNTFLDNNGNINTGGINMQDGAGVTLNFNDNQISGSGHVSASAFFGDGSNLENVSATPRFRYYTIRTKTTINNLFNTAQTMDLYDQGGAASGINQSSNELTWFSAPGSGSIARVIYTPIQGNSTATTNTIRATDTPQFYFRRNSIVEGTPVQGIAAHTTASSANLRNLSVTNQAGTFETKVAVFDLERNDPPVSGSNSFEAGDILVFAGRNDQTVHPLMVTIVLKIQEEGVTYP